MKRAPTASVGFHWALMSLSARRLGFAPSRVSVELSDASSASVSIRMKPLAATLAPVVVRPTRVNYAGRLKGYYERLEKKSSGVFITREQIDRENPRMLGQLLQHVPGITATTRRGGVTNIRMRGRTCWPLVWVDGTAMPSGDVDIDTFSPSTIHGIEIYLGSTTAPARYTYNRDVSSCGTILIWSRGPDTDPTHHARLLQLLISSSSSPGSPSTTPTRSTGARTWIAPASCRLAFRRPYMPQE